MRLAVGRSPGLVTEIDPVEASRHFPLLGPLRRALFNPAGRRVDGRVLNAALPPGSLPAGPAVPRRGGHGHPPRPDRRVDLRGGHLGGDGAGGSGGDRRRRMVVRVRTGPWAWPSRSPRSRDRSSTWPYRNRQQQLVHRPTGTGLLPGALAGWAGRLRGDHGGRRGVRRPSDGRGRPPTPPAGMLHTAPRLGGRHCGRDPSGIGPATPDDRPILGRVPGWANAFVATGHGAEGLLLGPYSALLVARTILGLDPPGRADEGRRCRPHPGGLVVGPIRLIRVGQPVSAEVDDQKPACGDDGAVEVLTGHAAVIRCLAEGVDGTGGSGDPIAPSGVE